MENTNLKWWHVVAIFALAGGIQGAYTSYVEAKERKRREKEREELNKCLDDLSPIVFDNFERFLDRLEKGEIK